MLEFGEPSICHQQQFSLLAYSNGVIQEKPDLPFQEKPGPAEPAKPPNRDDFVALFDMIRQVSQVIVKAKNRQMGNGLSTVGCAGWTYSRQYVVRASSPCGPCRITQMIPPINRQPPTRGTLTEREMNDPLQRA